MMKKKVAIGFILGGQHGVVMSLDEDGEPVGGKRKFSIDAQTSGVDVCRAVASVIREVHSALPANVSVIGVGGGTPGVVLANSKFGWYPVNFPNWGGADLAGIITDITGLPCVITNDAHTHATGEAKWGAGRGLKCMHVFTLGTGDGFGIVNRGIDGVPHVYNGATGFMEGGHQIVVPDGRLCGCGRLGCIEAYASAAGLRTRVKWLQDERDLLLNAPITDNKTDDYEALPIWIYRQARTGNMIAADMVNEAHKALALAANSAGNCGGAEAVILCGGWIKEGLWLRDQIIKWIQYYGMIGPANIDVVFGELGDDGAVMGGAALAFTELS